MKTASLPPLRVEPELREAAERLLRDGESLSGFVEQAVRQSVERRSAQEAFVARGLASSAAAKESGTYFSAASVVKLLESRLVRSRKRLARRRR